MVRERNVLESTTPDKSATYRSCYRRCTVTPHAQVFTWFLVILSMLLTGPAHAQLAPHATEHITRVHGRVVNSLTREPIARALVYAQGENAAAFSDDRGQFELNFRENIDTSNGPLGLRVMSHYIEARKPGFLQQGRMATTRYTLGPTHNQESEITLRLTPEALITGHLDVPNSEGGIRIQCQLYRREMRDAREVWLPDRTFTTWADGEFRFSELKAGTYKLITHEQMDFESLLAIPGAPLYGYPPMYYPNTTDFSVANPIVVKAGETARVSLAVARRQYYPVKIGVENVPAGQSLDLRVYPTGHHSPGWSLGYNPGDGTVAGMLPDGSYAVEAYSYGERQFSGILNFAVRGRPLEGPTLSLVPDATVTVRVHEEFETQPSNFIKVETGQGQQQSSGRRFSRVNVMLEPVDDFEAGGFAVPSQLPPKSETQELIIPNVRPGHYRVHVAAGTGYAAAIQSGGRDLTHQPLVVGLGGAVAPVDVVLKDDGAEITLSLEETRGPTDSETPAEAVVYLLPMGETSGRARNSTSPMWQGQFTFQQIPSGTYLALAFDTAREELLNADQATVQSLADKGQTLHVDAGQKLTTKLKVITSDEQ